MTNTHDPKSDRIVVVADLSDDPAFKDSPSEGEFVKLPQDTYDTLLDLHRNSGNEFLRIAQGYDTSDINLDENVKHDFAGRNVVYQVPSGSILGNESIIHNDAIIDNVTLGVEVVAGDNVIISNSLIKSDFEAGSSLALINCHVELRMQAVHIERLDGCSICPMCDIGRIDHLANNNVISPWFMVDEIGKIGSNNMILGEEQLPQPLGSIGKNNKQIALDFDDVEKIYDPSALELNARKFAQKNGFKPLEITNEPGMKQAPSNVRAMNLGSRA